MTEGWGSPQEYLKTYNQRILFGKTAKTTDEHYDALIEMNKTVNKLIKRLDKIEKKLIS